MTRYRTSSVQRCAIKKQYKTKHISLSILEDGKQILCNVSVAILAQAIAPDPPPLAADMLIDMHATSLNSVVVRFGSGDMIGRGLGPNDAGSASSTHAIGNADGMGDMKKSSIPIRFELEQSINV